MRISYRNITPSNLQLLKELKAGEWIRYTGELITLRDSSQMMLLEEYRKKGRMPVDLRNKVIMYAAPTEGKDIVIGPTTSRRMDGSLDLILDNGVVATIGKGARTVEAVGSIQKHKAPYLLLMSGVSAYLSRFFSGGEIIAFKELGPEAIRKYTASELPLLVGIDPFGKSIFSDQ